MVTTVCVSDQIWVYRMQRLTAADIHQNSGSIRAYTNLKWYNV